MPEPAVRRNIHYIGIALIVLGVFAAYWPAMHGEFVWDDDLHVTENRTLRNVHGLKLIWTNIEATAQFYPLTHTTFWIQYQLFGPEPIYFHLGNIILHAGTSLTLWWVLHRLGLKGAFLIALLFAWHPVHVESVAWISERKNTLSGFFYMLAAACGIRAFRLDTAEGDSNRPQWWWYALLLACALAGILAKTIASTLPAALMLIAWWKRRRIDLKLAAWLAPLWIAAVIFGRITAHLEHTAVGTSGPEYAISFIQRILIASRAIVFYATKLGVPVDLTFNYPRWYVDPNVAWQWAFPAGLVLVVVTLWACRKRIGYGPIAGLFFFMGTVFPALGFVNIYPMRYSFVADHFQYLASIGLLALLGEAIVRYTKPTLPDANAGTIICAVVPLTLLFLTFQQAHIFESRETLWTDTLVKNERSWLACDHLAHLRYEAASRTTDLKTRHRLLADAEAFLLQSLKIEPDHPEVYLGLANVRVAQGRKGEAIELVRKASAVRPNRINPLQQLGTMLENDQPQLAIEAYTKVLQIDARYDPARLGLARCLARTGRLDEAIAQCRKAIELFPAGIQSRVLLGDLYLNRGAKREAREAYQSALNLDPTNTVLQDRLRRVQ